MEGNIYTHINAHSNYLGSQDDGFTVVKQPKQGKKQEPVVVEQEVKEVQPVETGGKKKKKNQGFSYGAAKLDQEEEPEQKPKKHNKNKKGNKDEEEEQKGAKEDDSKGKGKKGKQMKQKKEVEVEEEEEEIKEVKEDEVKEVKHVVTYPLEVIYCKCNIYILLIE